MENDSYLLSNFDSICRLCLGKSGVMSSIFDNVTDSDCEVPLITKISDFIEVQIHPNDGLPTRICHRCLFKTEKCAKFRSKCAENDAKLRRLTQRATGEGSGQNSPDVSYSIKGKRSNEYIVEDSVVMVVDPSLDYDSSDISDSEQLEKEQEVENNYDEPVAESYFKNVFMCQYCDQAFVSLEACQEHETNVHNPAIPYGCSACDMLFADRSSHIQHAKMVHGNDKPYQCSQCDKGFGRRSDLRKHSIVHTGVRPFQCQFCLKSFSRNTNLSKHLRIHSGQKPHVCPQCPRSFISKGDLSRHILVHSGVKPYACQKCPLTFGRRDKLLKHESRHDAADVPYVREIAVKQDSDNELNEQEDMVVSVDPYKSLQENEHINYRGQFSDKSVDVASAYEMPRVPEHITGEASFITDVTSAKNNVTATSGLYLNGTNSIPKPVKILTKPKLVKGIKCHQCSKRFMSLDAYKTHLAVHMGVRNFQCKICFKKFKRKRELDRHSVLHTGFKPFECSQCDKKFGRKDKLVRHERTHDDGMVNMPCIECGMTFATKEELVTHLKGHFGKLEHSFGDDMIEDENEFDYNDGSATISDSEL